MISNFTRLLAAVLVMLLPVAMSAQSVAINDDGTAPHASAMLDIKVNAAAKKGLLIPRMTSAQRSAIASPAAGLMVYDTDTQSFWYWNASAWTNLAGGGGSGPWAQLGSRIHNTNTGNVGIGTTNPRAKLNVAAGRPVLFGLDTAGLGVKTFWLPSKAAFRTGVIEDPFGAGSDSWEYSNIGWSSFAAGGDNSASGEYSASFGQLSVATGKASFSAGLIAQAMGRYSAAFGEYSAAMGDISFVANGATANGDFGAGFNRGYAEGESSFAANEGTASAWYSGAMGFGTTMRSFAGLAIGQNNDPILAAPELSVSTNQNSPLFIIGNAANLSPLRNAFVVLRSGRTSINKNPVTTTANAGMLQVKQLSGVHALQLEEAASLNDWSFNVSPHLQLYYNNVLRGTFSNSTGGYTAVSDMRLKKDILPLGSILTQLMNMKPYTYHLKDNESTDPLSFGFMAQEVEKIMPGLVTKMKDDKGETLLGMNYTNFAVLAIKAIQEQQSIIEEVRNENWELKKRMEKQEERLKRLEQLLEEK